MKLFLGDCLEIMEKIPDKSIDLILCDIPYGTTSCKWDSVIPFEPLWEHYNRLIVTGGLSCFSGLSRSLPRFVCQISSRIVMNGI